VDSAAGRLATSDTTGSRCLRRHGSTDGRAWKPG
jgi:hypothetical protein